MEREEILVQLQSPSIEVYLSALQKCYRIAPHTELEFQWAVRIFRWYAHEFTFGELLDEAKILQAVLEKHRAKFQAGDYFDRKYYNEVTEFLRGYIEDGKIDMNELLISTHLEGDLTTKIKDTESGVEDLGVMQAFAERMKQLEAAKHEVYNFIRSFGLEHVGYLRQLLMVGTENHQSFLLHALDVFYKSAEVKQLYQDFIATTEDKYLKREAKKYLSQMN